MSGTSSPSPADPPRRVTQPMGRVPVAPRIEEPPHPIFGTPKFVLGVTIVNALIILVQTGLHFTHDGSKSFGVEYSILGYWFFLGLYTFVAFNAWAIFSRGGRHTLLWPRVYKRRYQTEWVKNYQTGQYEPPENGSFFGWVFTNGLIILIGLYEPYMFLTMMSS